MTTRDWIVSGLIVGALVVLGAKIFLDEVEIRAGEGAKAEVKGMIGEAFKSAEGVAQGIVAAFDAISAPIRRGGGQ